MCLFIGFMYNVRHSLSMKIYDLNGGKRHGLKINQLAISLSKLVRNSQSSSQVLKRILVHSEV